MEVLSKERDLPLYYYSRTADCGTIVARLRVYLARGIAEWHMKHPAGVWCTDEVRVLTGSGRWRWAAQPVESTSVGDCPELEQC